MPRDMTSCLDAGYTAHANTDGPSSEYDHDGDGDSDSFSYPFVHESVVVILSPSLHQRHTKHARTHHGFVVLLPA